MRYRLKHVGQERIKTRFAFLPIKIDDEIRWLESVKIRQLCISVDNMFNSSSWHTKWVNMSFVDDTYPKRIYNERFKLPRYFVFNIWSEVEKVKSLKENPQDVDIILQSERTGSKVFESVTDMIKGIAEDFHCEPENLYIQLYEYNESIQQHIFRISSIWYTPSGETLTEFIVEI